MDFYEAALPWVLTPAEMERPFSAMGNSVTLGVHLDEARTRTPEALIRHKRSANELVIEDGDELALPFVADDDEDVGGFPDQPTSSVVEPSLSAVDLSGLGAFVRRCREDRKLFAGQQETVKVDDLVKQLDVLMHQAGLDKAAPEVVTVFEEPAL